MSRGHAHESNQATDLLDTPLGMHGHFRRVIAVPDDRVHFERHEIETGPAPGQTVLTGFLPGGAFADIAVINVDGNGDRRLRIYAFADGIRASRFDTPLGPEVRFIDVAGIGGRDRLITFEPGRICWFDPEMPGTRPLARFPADFRVSDGSVIPHVDITRDLNGGDRADLVMPEVDGFWVSTQLDEGSFTDAVKLGPPEPFAQVSVGDIGGGGTVSSDTRTFGGVDITAKTIPWYLGRIHAADFDRDGRRDLLFWNEGHFDVHLQDASGS